jgi:DNA mismatch repair protein MutS
VSTATDSSKAKASDPRDTPAMRQYRRFKQQHPECVLFFRMGDFYEMFDDDAITVAKALNLTLTQRSTGIPMAGVPYHAAENYLRRMIAMGYRVAVCDQIQDPKEAKGVVDRAVTRVLTPGTLVDEQLLDESAANQVGAIQFLESGDASSAVLALAELSTGRFTLHDLPTGRVLDELARLRPTELLYVETADGTVPDRVGIIREQLGLALSPRPGWLFRQDDARYVLLRHYNVTTLAGFGLEEDDHAIGPAGALLQYLLETQSGRSDQADTDDARNTTQRLGHLRPPVRQSHDAYLTIDAASLRSLEIERTMRTGQIDGSLLATLQRCNSPMGKRLLRTWLCFPLRDRDAIGARQHAVSAMIADRGLTEQLAAQISHVQDVARIAGRMAMHRATPRDLVALGRSVGCITTIADLLDARPAFAAYHEQLTNLGQSLAPLAATIAQRCVDDPPSHLREGGLFRDDIDAELDEARMLQRDANTWLAAYQKRLAETTDIPSLKVGYNKVFGYYIEITHAHTAKVPDAFSRKQTLKNAERYITPELKEFEDKVMTAESRAIEREKTLFERLCRQAATEAASLSCFAELVAELDVLCCFGDVATRFGYVKPELVDEPVLAIVDGRHPVLDRTLGERFVPNDCTLGGPSPDASTNTGTLALITGPNMAGKSTYIRQVALITLLAHTGCFVPAKSATIGITDRIFTRIGASDELHAGHSTFMVEMTETANILHHATERSLVILDEIGRGTSTLDGLSLAWAIAETLAARRCRALFATHYHELTSLAERMDNVSNLHVSVREWGDEIVFLYRLLRGSTDRSYGIHVAKIAGVPKATLTRAQELLDTLAVQTDATAVEAAAGSPVKKQPESQMSLFTEYVHHPALDELKAIDLNDLTPMQAFDRLRTIIKSLEP